MNAARMVSLTLLVMATSLPYGFAEKTPHAPGQQAPSGQESPKTWSDVEAGASSTADSSPNGKDETKPSPVTSERDANKKVATAIAQAQSSLKQLTDEAPKIKNSLDKITTDISKAQSWLMWLTALVILVLAMTLLNTFLLLRGFRQREVPDLPVEPNKILPSPDRPEIEAPPAKVVEDKQRSLPGGQAKVNPPASATLPPPAPVAPPVLKLEKPKPARPVPDEFAGLPHGAIGKALSLLRSSLPDLAQKIPDPRQQERFLADLDRPLKARIDRFKEAARRGDDYLREHWIEQDLVTTLNTLAQWLSSIIEERHRGRRGNRALEEELLRWLYEQLAPICRDEGWFFIEQILPFTTKFDPNIHYSVGSVPLPGAGNLVVEIKAIGRRDPRQQFVTHKAEVIVGR
ncbi:MAG TPA: hypothetical protein VLX28_15950 [Thermoanaerobaculia bacterium]|nr:hypothetical protein [Thermoanaerobaculia bacterium]